MAKKQRYRVLSIVMTLFMLLSNFVGIGGQNIVKADATSVITEGFDSVIVGTDSNKTIDPNSLPAGWTFTGITSGYPSTSTGYFGVAAPAIKFASTNAQILTPTFNLAGDGTLSFWIRGASVNTESHLLVESSDSSTWTTLEDIKPISNTATTKTYVLNSTTKQIRFTYTKSSGNCALDDVIITQNSTPVTVPVESVSLDKTSLTMYLNDTVTLNATVNPSTATNKNISWSSDNPTAATVDQETGLVTGVSTGTANITVTTEDGNKIATCAVTVTDTPNPLKTFDLIEITDFHGQLLNNSNTVELGAIMAKQIKDIQAANPNDTIVIGGGDLYQGTPVSNVLQGVPVQQVLTNLGMVTAAIGNHEFDWGLNTINTNTMAGAGYNMICANLRNKSDNSRVYDPYKIVTKDGVKIAFIGAITIEAPSIILPANIADFNVTDPVTEVNNTVTELKALPADQKPDIIIFIDHEGGSALKSIVNNLHGIDVVFGGHSHEILDTTYTDADGNSVPTKIAQSNCKGFIDLKMTVDSTTNRPVSFSASGNFKTTPTAATSPMDLDIKNLIDTAYAGLASTFNEVVGHDDVAYNRTQVTYNSGAYGQSQLGNWMADVVKNYAQSDIGMVNNGGIRTDMPAGDITVGMLFSIMPFDNLIYKVTMTGAQLKAILEQAVMTGGKGIQVSGLKFTYDPSLASGSRIASMKRESDDLIINPTDTIIVAAPDFVATGGDGFAAFVDSTNYQYTQINTYELVRDALIANVRANGEIVTGIYERIRDDASQVVAQPMTTEQARATGGSGSAIVTGIVTMVSGNSVFIQDSTGGLCIYNNSGTTFTMPSRGDQIQATGSLSSYYGLIELKPAKATDVVKLASGPAYAPQVVTVSQITAAMQSQLVQLNNVNVDSIDTSNNSITVSDQTGSIMIYKAPATVTGFSVGDKINVTAAVSPYNSTMELAVGAASDVVKVSSGGGTTTPAGITIIGTSDLHGAIYPMDYNTGAVSNVGLAKISTYVKSVRAANPNTMLVDAGDTIQGTPLVYYYNMIDKTTEYPMMKVMGAMGYDTWTLGNHEFNYGLETLNRVIADAKKEGITVLSANTYNTADNSNFVNPYYIKSFTVNGRTIKVGILGLTTKTIPNWEDPAHYAGLQFNDLVTEAQKWVPIVKAAGADVVIATIHSGIKGSSDTIPENQIDEVAQQVSGIDAILCGHTHSAIAQRFFTNPDGKQVPVTEPKNGDGVFSQLTINIDDNGNVTGVTTKNVSLTNDIAADPDILAIAQPYQDATLAYTNTVIGQSTGEFSGAGQLTGPTAIMELINKVQMNAASSQLSIAAPLSSSARIPQGDIKRQDIMGVYVYENFLFGVNMTGKQLKNWFEWSVRYYKQTTGAGDPIVKDPVLKIADYNLDQLYGATYDIDLSEAACTTDTNGLVAYGNRIKNLKFNGKLVKDTDVFSVAINNYRYNGGGGFMTAAGLIPGSNATIAATYYDSAKALGDDGQVRNMMFKYVQDNGTISPTCSNNWRISAIPVVQEVGVTGIILNNANLDIRIGNSQTLVAIVLPENATNKNVIWSSSDENVASVVDGVVTGLSKGTATITVTTIDGNLSATAVVNVAASAIGIELNKSDLKLEVGKTQKLVAQFVPGNMYNRDFTWESSNTDVATVKDGIVTAVGPGTTTIIVKTKDGLYQANITVVIVNKVAYIKKAA